jgi:hypothetical protein
MNDELTLEWSAKTRRFLGTSHEFRAIQLILRSLTPEIDQVLYDVAEDIPWPRRKTLNLDKEDALLNYAKEETDRQKPIFERWEREFGHRLTGRPPKRETGGLFVQSRDAKCWVMFDWDQLGLLPGLVMFRNSLKLRCHNSRVSSFDSRNSEDSMSRRIFSNDLFEWGHCCRGDEYSKNNMDNLCDGAHCAVGLDVSKMLPGFYWGNYFGPFLIEKIGESKFTSVPGCNVERLGHGILVTNEFPPDAWQSSEYQSNRVAAMEHLGRHFFFEKGKELKGSLFPVEPIRGVPENAPPSTIEVWMK